jgi:hypothetical protein
MLPQGSVPQFPEPEVPASTAPEPEAPEYSQPEPAYYDIRRPRRRYALRTRILVFAILVGGVLAVLMAFVTTTLSFLSIASQGFAPDFRESRLFLPALFQQAASFAPSMMLVAVIAAAADALVKRSGRASQDTAEVLERLSRNNGRSPNREGRDERPAGRLDMEIDPRAAE